MSNGIRLAELTNGNELQRTDKIYAVRGSGVGADRYVVIPLITDSGNTVLGKSSLTNVTGTNNTVLGYNIGNTLVEGVNNILIGSGIDVATAAASDSLNIGGALTGTVGTAKTINSVGNFSVATNKLTVAATTGNTAIAGTLGVTGALSGTSGAFSTTLGCTGNFAVNTNKFSVAATTGNTLVAGTLGITGATSGTSGAFSTTLGCTGNFAVNTDKFNVTASTGECSSAKRFHTGAIFTAVGANALGSTNTGADNTALGLLTLQDNTSGYQNTAVGSSALENNTTGYHNTACGTFALITNTVGFANTAVGRSALYSNTNGDQNTACGVSALTANNIGNNNTAVGYMALSTLNDIPSNCAGLGANAQVAGGQEIQLGDSALAGAVYGFGGYAVRSDGRDKEEVRDTQLGLDFIMAIRPVDYKLDLREAYHERIDTVEVVEVDGKQVEQIKRVVIEHPKDGSKRRNRFHHGFIAQEVQATGFEFCGVKDGKISGNRDVYSIVHEEFIGPMVKAIQEQQAMIEDLQKRLAKLEAK